MTEHPCSVPFGKNITDAPVGTARGVFLVVDDIRQAREHLRVAEPSSL